MDRLTSKDIVAGGEIFDLKVGVPEEKAFNLLGQYENTGLTPAEVAELSQAKVEGLLLVLPCRVGDKVYEVSGGEIYEMTVTSFEIDKDATCMYLSEDVNYGSQGYDFSDFGETVFLTKPEAQAALDRMEGKE